MSDNGLDAIICLRPFYSLELNIRGDVSTCCPAWVKGMVGNTRKKSLAEIWNDEPIRNMRRMMLEGRWEKICRPGCPFIMSYRLKGRTVALDRSDEHPITEEVLSAVRTRQTVLRSGPTLMNMANSTVCNINCIMCGREHHRDDPRLVEKTMSEVTAMLPSLREVFLTGNGDPFARPDTRQFLLGLDPAQYPELRINLLTNGLLLTKYWNRVRHLNFGYLDISIDAATKETYETIRRGGKWEDLLQTLEVVGQEKDRFNPVLLNMTVMRENYREIPAFVELASRYGFTVGINRIRGKWGNQNFFTSGEKRLLDELREVIAQARERAESLKVPFNSSSFDDIMAGEGLPAGERYRQLATNLLKALYYKIK